LQNDDLEKTSIEDEVLDVDVGGEDQPEDPQMENDKSSDAAHQSDHEVTRIAPGDVVHTEFCIASSTKILELIDYIAILVKVLDVERSYCMMTVLLEHV
jgi:hypothetical protein